MMKDDIFYLTKLCGLTGEEDEVSRGLSILLEPLVDEMKIDEMGNLIGIRRCADPYAERLLLTAHMDQVGMVITDIVDEGFACVARRTFRKKEMTVLRFAWIKSGLISA